MQINQNETQLQLIYSLSDFEKLVDYIESIPNNIAIQRRNNYHITDKSSNIQYQVFFKNGIAKEQLLLIFKKEDLITQDITDLIESLEEKLEKQQKLMCKFFEDSQQISFSKFKSIEYSPTHLVFEIKFGNIVECRFCISHIIGNSLMDITDSEFNIQIINLLPSKNKEIFKSPPLNIQLYLQQKNLQEIINLTCNTYIPIQVLNSKFQDPKLAYWVSEVVIFTPNLKFGNFEFRCNLEQASLFIQMQTTFINDTLAIAIFEGNGLATLKGCTRRIVYQDYQTKIRSFIKKWELSTFQEVEDFFKDFLYFTLGYVILYSKTSLDLLFQSIDNVLLILQRLLHKIYQLTERFQNRRMLESEQEKNICYQVINHYFQGFICKQHTQNHIFFEQFIDKLDQIIENILQKVPLTRNLKEIESKLKSVQLSFMYKQNKIIITIEHHNQQYEYEFFDNNVVKLNFQEQVKSWRKHEFPQTEIDFILHRFQVKQ